MTADDDLVAAIRAVVRAEIEQGLAPMQEQISAVKTALEDRSDSPTVESALDDQLTVKEAAWEFKKHQSTIRRWIKLHGIGGKTKTGTLVVRRSLLSDLVLQWDDALK